MKRFLASLALFLTVGCGRSHVVNHTKASIIRVTGLGTEQTMFGPIRGQEVCTGFVVGPELVLTAAHCVGENMSLDGSPTELVRADVYFDLALYRVKGLTKPPLKFRGAPVTFDEELTGIGYGFGWETPLAINLRVTIPNHRNQEDKVSGIIMQGDVVQGMSGGTLVDESGKVVGINLQTHAGESYSVGVQVIKTFLLDAGVE